MAKPYHVMMQSSNNDITTKYSQMEKGKCYAERSQTIERVFADAKEKHVMQIAKLPTEGYNGISSR